MQVREVDDAIRREGKARKRLSGCPGASVATHGKGATSERQRSASIDIIASTQEQRGAVRHTDVGSGREEGGASEIQTPGLNIRLPRVGGAISSHADRAGSGIYGEAEITIEGSREEGAAGQCHGGKAAAIRHDSDPLSVSAVQ